MTLEKVMLPKRPSTLCFWTLEHVDTDTWIMRLMVIMSIYLSSGHICDRIIDIFMFELATSRLGHFRGIGAAASALTKAKNAGRKKDRNT